MRQTVFQRAELRDENDVIVQQGTYGKGSALSNSTNDGWVDYVMNNLEALYGIAKDEVVPVSALPASGDMNKTYLLTTTGVCYRWDGTEWVEISSSEAVGRAESAATLAEQWATKTNGTVDDSEYSAKYYANAAQQSADDAQDVADDMADHLAQIDQNTGGVSANSKRIGNIEKLLQGNLYDYDTDDDTAYTKSVPAGAMPYAGLEKVGGKTVVWNQLNNNAHASQTINGVTFTKNDDGSWTVSGTPTARAYIYTHVVGSSTSVAVVAGHKYLQLTHGNIAGVNVNGSWYDANRSYISGANANTILTVPTNAALFSCGLIDVTSSLVGTAIDFTMTTMFFDLTLMFGAGNEPSTVEEFESMFPASYYPYNAGTLLSAGVTEVVSVGKNLLNPNDINRYQNMEKVGDVFENTVADSRSTAYVLVQLYKGNSYIFSQGFTLAGDDGRRTSTFTTTDDIDVVIIGHSGSPADEKVWFNLKLEKGKTYTASIKQTGTASNVVGGFSFTDVQVEESATATAYSPYMSNDYPIPAEIQALEGYGWSAGSVYNYIDYERKVFVKRVARVDLGTLTWRDSTDSQGQYFYTDNITDRQKIAYGVYPNITSTLYTSALSISVGNKQLAFAVGNQVRVFVRDTDYTNTSDYTTAMSGVYLYYELATAVETDISAYITDDNLIEVEANGTLTFPNSNGTDYQIPVPSEEEYMIDLQSALGE